MPLTREVIDKRVSTRMDTLEWMLKNNYHLKDPHFFEEVLGASAKYWQYLNEADREYWEAARYCLDNNRPWTVGDPKNAT